MDLTQLSQQLVQFLAPALPFLLGLGGKAAEEAAKKLGAEAWEQAKALWGKLKPKVEAKPAAQEAAQEVAAHPADEDAQAALRLQLRKLLADVRPRDRPRRAPHPVDARAWRLALRLCSSTLL